MEMEDSTEITETADATTASPVVRNNINNTDIS